MDTSSWTAWDASAPALVTKSPVSEAVGKQRASCKAPEPDEVHQPKASEPNVDQADNGDDAIYDLDKVIQSLKSKNASVAAREAAVQQGETSLQEKQAALDKQLSELALAQSKLREDRLKLEKDKSDLGVARALYDNQKADFIAAKNERASTILDEGVKMREEKEMMEKQRREKALADLASAEPFHCQLHDKLMQLGLHVMKSTSTNSDPAILPQVRRALEVTDPRRGSAAGDNPALQNSAIVAPSHLTSPSKDDNQGSSPALKDSAVVASSHLISPSKDDNQGSSPALKDSAVVASSHLTSPINAGTESFTLWQAHVVADVAEEAEDTKGSIKQSIKKDTEEDIKVVIKEENKEENKDDMDTMEKQYILAMKIHEAMKPVSLVLADFSIQNFPRFD
ncbi:hypothetical protein N0V82_010855 [Gnomoniopsis sp. IMI 355080]|nr:hypothetical protein N0V82_010855 [Gnomoniopsis sp. IMI 355080]